MPDGAKTTPHGETVLSTKGQVVLPKALREDLGWPPGTRIEAVRTAEGVLLRRAPLFRPTTMDEVFGSARYHGSPRTLEEMDEGIAEAVHESWLESFAGD